MVIQNGRFQGIFWRGTKYYYNPYKNIRSLYADKELMAKEQLDPASMEYYEGVKHYRPDDLFYNDARKLPRLYFSEDYIREKWNQQFSDKYSHVFSLLSKDSDIYNHPRDRWVREQVALMKKRDLSYGEGDQAMQREFQKQQYVAQLERQHQLQQIQERGGSTFIRTHLAQKIANEDLLDKIVIEKDRMLQAKKVALRSMCEEILENQNTAREKYLTEYKTIKSSLTSNLTSEDIQADLENANEDSDDDGKVLEKKEVKEDANEDSDDGGQVLPISMLDYDPTTLNQQFVLDFINENPECASCFDASWYAFDQTFMYFLSRHHPEHYNELVLEFERIDSRFDRYVESKDPAFWETYSMLVKHDYIQEMKDKTLPGGKQVPSLLWEDIRRNAHFKDSEFVELMEKAGNTEVRKWFDTKEKVKDEARNNIHNLYFSMLEQARVKDTKKIRDLSANIAPELLALRDENDDVVVADELYPYSSITLGEAVFGEELPTTKSNHGKVDLSGLGDYIDNTASYEISSYFDDLGANGPSQDTKHVTYPTKYSSELSFDNVTNADLKSINFNPHLSTKEHLTNAMFEDQANESLSSDSDNLESDDELTKKE